MLAGRPAAAGSAKLGVGAEPRSGFTSTSETAGGSGVTGSGADLGGDRDAITPHVHYVACELAVTEGTGRSACLALSKTMVTVPVTVRILCARPMCSLSVLRVSKERVYCGHMRALTAWAVVVEIQRCVPGQGSDH